LLSKKDGMLKPWLQALLGLLAGLLLAGAFILVADRPHGAAVELKPVPSAAPLVVEISGAVTLPGVYTLPPGSRLADALTAAGGLLPSADRSQVNLAALLSDGARLHIPGVEAAAQPLPQATLADSTKSIRIDPTLHINLNTATLAELIQLPGIGETRAKAILAYRDAHGGFQSLDEIQNVSGIGEATFQQIKVFLFVK
jgi:competence protein ComEA